MLGYPSDSSEFHSVYQSRSYNIEKVKHIIIDGIFLIFFLLIILKSSYFL